MAKYTYFPLFNDGSIPYSSARRNTYLSRTLHIFLILFFAAFAFYLGRISASSTWSPSSNSQLHTSPSQASTESIPSKPTTEQEDSTEAIMKRMLSLQSIRFQIKSLKALTISSSLFIVCAPFSPNRPHILLYFPYIPSLSLLHPLLTHLRPSSI